MPKRISLVDRVLTRFDVATHLSRASSQKLETLRKQWRNNIFFFKALFLYNICLGLACLFWALTGWRIPSTVEHPERFPIYALFWFMMMLATVPFILFFKRALALVLNEQARRQLKN